MSDLQKAQEMMAASVASKTAEDPEIASVKKVLKLLDKTAKSNRTYGATNPVALKFSQQLYEELTAHLTQYQKLSFLVQRSALTCKDHVVYQPENEGGTESVAFKLYADGIRELVLQQGLTREDLDFFLESLWGGIDPTKDDDDIVTRLWERNLSTLTLVTAEEVANASGGTDGFLVLDGGMSTSDSTLRELLDRERGRGKASGGVTADGAGSESGAAEARRRFKSSLIGYEVTPDELTALTTEIETESTRDGVIYVLDMVSAILASEKSPVVLSRLFGLWGKALDELLRAGRWTVIESLLSLLDDVEAVRPDLSDEHKGQLAAFFAGLGRPERMRAIEAYLNRTPNAKTEGLSTILLHLKADAIQGLCSLLASLESPVHQALVSDVIMTVGKDHPSHVLRGLADRRPAYVKNLLAILTKWNNPRFAEPVEKLSRYPDAGVRKEVIRAMSLFRPNGNGTKLIAFVGDTDESVRLAALKLLMSGQYTAPFAQWSSVLNAEEFMDRPLSERRAVYQSIRATSGDEAIPYWQQLMTEWSWSNRKKKEELAVLAAEALGKLGTPAAVATLELGQKKGGAAVRQACTMALSHIQKQQRGKPPLAAAS